MYTRNGSRSDMGNPQKDVGPSRDVPVGTGFLCDTAAEIVKTIKTLYKDIPQKAKLTMISIMTS